MFISLFNGNVKETALACSIDYSYAKTVFAKPAIKEAIKLRHNKEYNPKILSRQERQAWWTLRMCDESLDMKDRLKASELLGKSEADFTENINTNPRGMKLLDAAIKGEALQIAAIRLDAIIINKGVIAPALPVIDAED